MRRPEGIIHRDLKPANIKVRKDATVKVLDFDLAKALDPVTTRSAPAMTNSPTITSPALMTGVGVLLGTAVYMSPEQAKGRPADARSRYSSVSISTNGTLVYGQGSAPEPQQLTWFDRAGRAVDVLGEPTPYDTLALSPSEHSLAVAMRIGVGES